MRQHTFTGICVCVCVLSMRQSRHLRHLTVWGRYVSSGCPGPPAPAGHLILVDSPGVCRFHVAVPAGLEGILNLQTRPSGVPQVIPQGPRHFK
jgi:hypothetical protein